MRDNDSNGVEPDRRERMLLAAGDAALREYNRRREVLPNHDLVDALCEGFSYGRAHGEASGYVARDAEVAALRAELAEVEAERDRERERWLILSARLIDVEAERDAMRDGIQQAWNDGLLPPGHPALVAFRAAQQETPDATT